MKEVISLFQNCLLLIALNYFQFFKILRLYGHLPRLEPRDLGTGFLYRKEPFEANFKAAPF